MNTLIYPSAIQDGQTYLQSITQNLIADGLEEVVEITENALLEPYIFAYFNQEREEKISLSQLIYGYTPLQNQRKGVFVNVRDNGVIYLPNVGYFHTSYANEQLYVSYGRGQYKVARNNVTISAEFEPLRYVGKQIEFVAYSHPFITNNLLTESLLAEAMPSWPSRESFLSFEKRLAESFELIKNIDLCLYDEINTVIKKIVLLRPNNYSVNFSAIDFHGSLFFIMYEDVSDIYLIDSIIHESSHTILNAILVNLTEYFQIDPFELRFVSPFRDERIKRGAYHVLHAAFVMGKLLNFYNECYTKSVFDDKDKCELEGNILYNIIQLRVALDAISDKTIYTIKGYQIYKDLDELQKKITIEQKNIIEKYDLFDVSSPTISRTSFSFRDFQRVNASIINRP